MKLGFIGLAAIAAAALAGCVTVPSGPSVMVLPGDGRSFDQFRYDEGDCRNYAYSQVGGATAGQAQADSVARSAILGTLLGAAVGVAIGDSGRAAATGAGVGLAMGAAAGSGAAQNSAYGTQRRYDMAYQQCMYSKGHRIAGRGGYQYPSPPVSYAPAAPAAPNYPVPPPGSAPPR